MKLSRYPRLVLVLLVVSVALNAWQFFWEVPPESVTAPRRSLPASSPRSSLARAQAPPVAASEEAADDEGDEIRVTPWSEIPVESQTEEELIFGARQDPGHQIRGPAQRVSLQRLREIGAMPASQAERLRLHGRLLLPGDKVLDLGEFDVKPGQKMRFERIKEFPYPNSFDPAQPQDSGSPFPVIPATPGSFDIQNTGLTAEIEVTAGPGSIMLAGRVTQRVFEGFSQMPGEAFLPIIDNDTLLTDNKVLMPQFTTREAPFVAAATAGQPCLVPVQTSFGHTFLELTCTPLE